MRALDYSVRKGRGRISTGKADTRVDDACCRRKVCSDAKTVRGQTSSFFAFHQRIERCEKGVRSDRDRSSEQDAELNDEADHWRESLWTTCTFCYAPRLRVVPGDIRRRQGRRAGSSAALTKTR